MKVFLYWFVFAECALACSDKNKDTCKPFNISLSANRANYTWTDECRYLNECDTDGCCIHKDLMPLKPSEAGGTVLVFVISGMSNAAGIGGGPIMTAFEILLFYFNPKQAIPLSQVIIFAGGVVSFLIRAFLRHPTKNRPLCEYHVSMMIIPPILFGSTFGVMVNKVLPNVAILVMLTLVLIWITWLTTRNGIRLYKAESKQRRDAAQQESAPANGVGESAQRQEEQPLESLKDSSPAVWQHDDQANSNGLQINSEGRNSTARVKDPPHEELANIYSRESRQFPLIPVVWIVFIVGFAALGLSIRGSKGKSFAGIEFCGAAFKVFFALWSFFLLLLTFLPFFYLMRLKGTYDRLAYSYDQFDIKWTFRNCAQVYIAGFFGGFGGSLLGFGAALLVAPILVQWKVRSPVVAPTVALMTLIGSAISVMQFAQSKQLVGDYAGWLAWVAFVGSFVGVISITKLIRKLGRNSLLVLVLAAVLAIAMFLVPIYTLVDIIKKEKDGKGDYKLKPYCD